MTKQSISKKLKEIRLKSYINRTLRDKINNKKVLTEAEVISTEPTVEDICYKMYRAVTDAMFLSLKNKSTKTEFYKSLTDLQNQIEKFIYAQGK